VLEDLLFQVHDLVFEFVENELNGLHFRLLDVLDDVLHFS